jgi:predicted N-acetyltransferase YhbS
VSCRPATALLGLGDVAVAPDHRRRGVARTVCALATQEGWRLHASAILAKTKPLRGVLGDLGFEPVSEGRFYYVDGGRAGRTPTGWRRSGSSFRPSSSSRRATSRG